MTTFILGKDAKVYQGAAGNDLGTLTEMSHMVWDTIECWLGPSEDGAVRQGAGAQSSGLHNARYQPRPIARFAACRGSAAASRAGFGRGGGVRRPIRWTAGALMTAVTNAPGRKPRSSYAGRVMKARS